VGACSSARVRNVAPRFTRLGWSRSLPGHALAGKRESPAALFQNQTMRFDFLRKRGKKKKPHLRPPPWLPDLRLSVFDVKFLIHLGRRWDDIFLMRPGSQRVSFLRCVPHGIIDWQNTTTRTEYLMGVFDKIPTGPLGADGGKLPEDSDFLDRWPSVFELMTATKYPGGQPREKSSLFFVIEEGAFKISIAERTRDLSLWASGPTFFAALDTLEQRLTSDAPEWRSKGKGGRKKG
jgi:hypothetical protein